MLLYSEARKFWNKFSPLASAPAKWAFLLLCPSERKSTDKTSNWTENHSVSPHDEENDKAARAFSEKCFNVLIIICGKKFWPFHEYKHVKRKRKRESLTRHDELIEADNFTLRDKIKQKLKFLLRVIVYGDEWDVKEIMCSMIRWYQVGNEQEPK